MFVDFNWFEAIGSSPILIILIACSVLALGVTLERATYYLRRRDNPREILTRIQEQIGRGAIKEALWTAKGCKHPLGTAAAEMLMNRSASENELEERLHITLSEEKLLLEKNMAILGTLAAVAPLIGLLGTVYGIMMAFHDMGVTGSSSPAVVAAGVAEALLTTGAGLVVAVPCLILYNQFIRQMSVMLIIAENGGRTIRAALSGQAATIDNSPDDIHKVERIVECRSDSVKIPVTTEL